MDRAKLMEMFRSTASEVAEKDLSSVGEDSVISSLGVDSLAMLEVVGEMERSLAVQIPDDQLVGIDTVRQLLDVVERQVRGAA